MANFLCVLIALFVCLPFNACIFSPRFWHMLTNCSTDLPFTFKGTPFLGDKPGGFFLHFGGVVAARGESVYCH